MLLMIMVFESGCANFDLTAMVMPQVQQVRKVTNTSDVATSKEAVEQEAAPLKRLDFNQLTIKYVQARLEHPQLLEIFEHAEWRPHPLQEKWLEHPFRERAVSRFVLKITPQEEGEPADSVKKNDKPVEQEIAVNTAETIYGVPEVLQQGGYAALSHVIYLLTELGEVDEREKLLKDLKLISVLKGETGKHARILYLMNANEVEPQFLEETQEFIIEQKSWKTLPERAGHKALIGAWITGLVKQKPNDPVAALKSVGEYLSQTSLPDEIRGEMFLQLARYLPPVMIPGLQEALVSTGDLTNKTKTSVVMKNYGMQANLQYALFHTQGVTSTVKMPELEQPYPQAIWQMEWDEDANIRKMYAYWLTLVKPDQGLEILQRQLMDHDLKVRDAVLLAFGYWPQQEAKEQLLKYAKNPAENIRLATVSGLAGHGLEALRPLARDEAYRVRAQVAVELGYAPSLESAVILKELLRDQNLQVEQSAIYQLVKWPDELAVPLYIHSVVNSSRGTRLQAAYQLQQRTGMVITQLDGAMTERRDAVLKLAAEHGLPTNLWGKLMNPRGEVFSEQEQSVHNQELEQWLNQLKQQTGDQATSQIAESINLKRTDIPLLENFLKNNPVPTLRFKIVQELAKTCPEFAAIDQLRRQDVQQRRKAARSLADYAQEASLSPLLLEEVSRIIEQEQDEQVWRSIAQAISHDTGETQIRIIRMMLKHRWVDLQKLGCDFAAEHQLGTLAPDILLLFQSRDHTLIQKAVYSAGKLGNPSVIDHPQGGLRSLLNHPVPEVRKEASIALARLRDPQGIADLVRLAHSPDPTTRFAAIELMGELNDRTLIKQLHQLLWLEQDQRVKRCLIRSLERLSPPEAWPYKQGKQLSDQERSKLWIDYLNAG